MSLRGRNSPAVEWMRLALESYDAAKCAALWRAMRAKSTYLSPTLITRFNETKRGLGELSSDRATIVSSPSLVRAIWQEDASAVQRRADPDDAVFDRYYGASAARTAEAAQAGSTCSSGVTPTMSTSLRGSGFTRR